ncbi:LysR family transcriptional regulator [Agrobacterium vitis]|uniref:LysR substrate-binding domain-containing protein n=1 Tax=Agrobacterium vitis TaxID=373 RepID=UPI0012E976E8|nr:LysR substrate-binding domain-containing protein [Agrobacterium vitis]MVA81051.1 LysR family transcriptional regulator [Agrobacterium vitis]
MVLHVSLISLRTFVEVARFRSMKEAARSLGVTPGAISQQIRIVEERLGTALFERSSRDMHLTAEGTRLMEALNLPFQQIQDAVEDFRHRKPERDALVVTTVPSFASSWLVPRLSKFSTLYPDIEIKVDSSVNLVDLRHERVDVAIRHGSGNYAGMSVTQLLIPQLVVIGSPEFLASAGPIRQPSDCLALPLLQDRNRIDWVTWFRAHGVEDPSGRAARGTSFSDDALMIKAAASSQGLAIVRDIYAEEAIELGLVVIPIAASIGTPFSYYFVTKPQNMQNQRVLAFKNWLLAEIAVRPKLISTAALAPAAPSGMAIAATGATADCFRAMT